MSERIQLEVSTYTDEILNAGIKELYIPAFNGQVGILEDHKPYISLLEAGEMNYTDVFGKKFYYYIHKGVIKVIDNTISILCDSIEEIKLEKKKEIKDKLAELDELIKSFFSWIKLKKNFEEETNLEDFIEIIKKLEKISEKKLKLKQPKKKSKGKIDKLVKQKNKIEAQIRMLQDFKELEDSMAELEKNLKERKSLIELKKALKELEKKISIIEKYPKRLEKLKYLNRLKENINQIHSIKIESMEEMDGKRNFKKLKKIFRKFEKPLCILYIYYRQMEYLEEQKKLKELEKNIDELIKIPNEQNFLTESENILTKSMKIIEEFEEQESLKDLKENIDKLKEKLGKEIGSEEFDLLNEQKNIVIKQIKRLEELEGIKILDYKEGSKILNYEIEELEAQKKSIESKIKIKEPMGLSQLKKEIEELKRMNEVRGIIAQTDIDRIDELIKSLEETESPKQSKKIIKELIEFVSDKKEFSEIEELKKFTKELEKQKNKIVEQIESPVELGSLEESKKIKKELIKFLGNKKEFKEIEGLKKFVEGPLELESLKELETDIDEFKISSEGLENVPYKFLRQVKDKLLDISNELGISPEELKLEVILEKQREFEIKQRIIQDIESIGKPYIVEGVKG